MGTPSGDIQDSDQPKFFRQRRYFYYLSGIDLPDCVVTYNIQRDHLLAFILPQYTGRTVIYNGLNPSREEILAKYDFDHVTYLDSLTGYISHFANREDGSKQPSDLIDIRAKRSCGWSPYDMLCNILP